MTRILDRLRERAGLHFVGREDQLAVFNAALSADPPPCSIILMHGPGGVGKTALLEQVRLLAVDAGLEWIRLDARDLDGSVPGLIQALAGALRLLNATTATLSDVLDAWHQQPRRLLVIDTFEHIAHLEGWLRDAVLAHLPQQTVVVLSGRQPWSDFWRTDPVWRHGSHCMELGNLGVEEAHRLMQVRGIDDSLRQDLLTLTYGHPLAMTLVADVVDATGAVPAAFDTDLIRTLMDCFAAQAPSALHREALVLCAMARGTTQDMLADLVDGPQAASLFDWLQSLSFVERGGRGLFPHDLVRDAVVTESRWRAPAHWASVSRRLVRYHLDRWQRAGHAQRCQELNDLVFLQRTNPVMKRFYDFGSLGSVTFEPAAHASASDAADLLRREIGPSTAELFMRWRDHPADESWVVLDQNRRVAGVLLCVDLAMLDADEINSDPGLAQAWQWVLQRRPLNPGDKALCARMIAIEGGWAGSISCLNALQCCMGYLWLSVPDLAVFISVSDNVEFWTPMMNYIDFHELDAPSFDSDGRPFRYFVHDWRDRTVPQWLELLAARVSGEGDAIALAQDPAVQAASPLLRGAFEQALRDALKHWPDSGRLAQSPLLDCHFVRKARGNGDEPVQALRQTILDALAPWRERPGERKFLRALELTYLTPAGSQELAAERLGVPFGTYRYQLGKGLEKLASTLWSSETAVERWL